MVFRRALLALALTALAAGAGLRPTWAADLPPRHQALLLLRVLAYDRNVSKRAGKAVTVLVLAREDDRASEERATELALAFEEVAREVVVAGLPVKAEVLHVRDAAALDERLDALSATLAYVDEALAPLLPELTKATRRHDTLSAGPSRALVEAGLAVAVVAHKSRACVLVNLQASRLEGADLDSALLAVAELVHE
ncbi:MAG TPA: YfiR/HmsC family protein [Anaeromyxobacteraceae bacterium]|nr:YfiR/HmsC family protein [Anaeromyxobacteraceae bacterium]